MSLDESFAYNNTTRQNARVRMGMNEHLKALCTNGGPNLFENLQHLQAQQGADKGKSRDRERRNQIYQEKIAKQHMHSVMFADNQSFQRHRRHGMRDTKSDQMRARLKDRLNKRKSEEGFHRHQHQHQLPALASTFFAPDRAAGLSASQRYGRLLGDYQQPDQPSAPPLSALPGPSRPVKKSGGKQGGKKNQKKKGKKKDKSKGKKGRQQQARKGKKAPQKTDSGRRVCDPDGRGNYTLIDSDDEHTGYVPPNLPANHAPEGFSDDFGGARHKVARPGAFAPPPDILEPGRRSKKVHLSDPEDPTDPPNAGGDPFDEDFEEEKTRPEGEDRPADLIVQSDIEMSDDEPEALVQPGAQRPYGKAAYVLGERNEKIAALARRKQQEREREARERHMNDIEQEDVEMDDRFPATSGEGFYPQSFKQRYLGRRSAYAPGEEWKEDAELGGEQQHRLDEEKVESENGEVEEEPEPPLSEEPLLKAPGNAAIQSYGSTDGEDRKFSPSRGLPPPPQDDDDPLALQEEEGIEMKVLDRPLPRPVLSEDEDRRVALVEETKQRQAPEQKSQQPQKKKKKSKKKKKKKQPQQKSEAKGQESAAEEKQGKEQKSQKKGQRGKQHKAEKSEESASPVGTKEKQHNKKKKTKQQKPQRKDEEEERGKKAKQPPKAAETVSQKKKKKRKGKKNAKREAEDNAAEEEVLTLGEETSQDIPGLETAQSPMTDASFSDWPGGDSEWSVVRKPGKKKKKAKARKGASPPPSNPPKASNKRKDKEKMQKQQPGDTQVSGKGKSERTARKDKEKVVPKPHQAPAQPASEAVLDEPVTRESSQQVKSEIPVLHVRKGPKFVPKPGELSFGDHSPLNKPPLTDSASAPDAFEEPEQPERRRRIVVASHSYKSPSHYSRHHLRTTSSDSTSSTTSGSYLTSKVEFKKSHSGYKKREPAWKRDPPASPAKRAPPNTRVILTPPKHSAFQAQRALIAKSKSPTPTSKQSPRGVIRPTRPPMAMRYRRQPPLLDSLGSTSSKEELAVTVGPTGSAEDAPTKPPLLVADSLMAAKPYVSSGAVQKHEAPPLGGSGTVNIATQTSDEELKPSELRAELGLFSGLETNVASSTMVQPQLLQTGDASSDTQDKASAPASSDGVPDPSVLAAQPYHPGQQAPIGPLGAATLASTLPTTLPANLSSLLAKLPTVPMTGMPPPLTVPTFANSQQFQAWLNSMPPSLTSQPLLLPPLPNLLTPTAMGLATPVVPVQPQAQAQPEKAEQEVQPQEAEKSTGDEESGENTGKSESEEKEENAKDVGPNGDGGKTSVAKAPTKPPAISTTLPDAKALAAQAKPVISSGTAENTEITTSAEVSLTSESEVHGSVASPTASSDTPSRVVPIYARGSLERDLSSAERRSNWVRFEGLDANVFPNSLWTLNAKSFSVHPKARTDRLKAFLRSSQQ